MKNNSVYVLRAIHYCVHKDGKKGHYLKKENDIVECWTEKIGVFKSVKKAENVLKILVKQQQDSNKIWKDWETYFGFVLEEHYLDEALFCFDSPPKKDSYKNISHFESIRTYLSDGTLNCFSDIDERGKKKFKGRKDPITKIKEGDIAIEWNNNELVPILVDKLAFSKKEWKKNFKPNVYGDVTDDSGISFIANYGHCHPFSPYVFPISCLPYYKLKKKTLKAMLKEKEKYYKGDI